MDVVDEFGQHPRCPECDILLRDRGDAFRCPECAYSLLISDVEMPPPFDGPDFHDRR